MHHINLLAPKDIAELPDFQRQPPPSITGTCQQCGKCCRGVDCPALGTGQKTCRVYDARPIACRTWPPNQKEINKAGCPGFTQTGL